LRGAQSGRELHHGSAVRNSSRAKTHAAPA
jgi:hypothetical protein